MRSHLLPRAFALHLKGSDPNIFVTDLNTGDSSLSQSGISDPDLLCEEHEAVLSRLDAHAVEVALRMDRADIPPPGQGCFIKDADANLLVRFACSVLWRCHHSNRREVALFQLGSYAKLLENITFEGDMTIQPPVYLSFLETKKFDPKLILSLPAARRFNGYYRWGFIVSGMQFAIDLGNVKSKELYLSINGRRELPATVLDFEHPEMLQPWIDMANISGKKFRNLKRRR